MKKIIFLFVAFSFVVAASFAQTPATSKQDTKSTVSADKPACAKSCTPSKSCCSSAAGKTCAGGSAANCPNHHASADKSAATPATVVKAVAPKK